MQIERIDSKIHMEFNVYNDLANFRIISEEDEEKRRVIVKETSGKP